MLKKIIFSTAIVLFSLFLCSAGCDMISGGGGGSSSGGGYTGGSSGGGGSGGGSTGGGGGQSPKPVALTGISFASENISIAKDMTYDIATVAPLVFTPSNATNKKVTYSLSSTDLVELDATGTKLVAKAKGSNITLTATSADGGHKAECKVEVTDYVNLNSISLTTTSISLNKGETTNISNLIVFDPPNASNRSVTFEVPEGSLPFIKPLDNKGTIQALNELDVPAVVTIKSPEGTGDNFEKTLNVEVGKPIVYNAPIKNLSDGMKVVTAGNAIQDDAKIYAAIRLVAERSEGEFRQYTKTGVAYPKDFHFQLKPQGGTNSQFLHVFGTSGKQFSNTYNDNTGYAQNNYKKIDTGFYFTHEFFEIGSSGLNFENVVMEDRSKPGEFMGYADFFRSDKVSIKQSNVGTRGTNDSNIALFTVKFSPRDADHPNTIDKVSVTFDGFVPR